MLTKQQKWGKGPSAAWQLLVIGEEKKNAGAGGNQSADALERVHNTERPSSDGTSVFIGIKSVAILHV